jgi:type I restriction enzyme, R subunit
MQHMPPLVEQGLWPAQGTAIRNLERSLAENRSCSLIQMATGSGKTFMAISFVYRLIKFAGAAALEQFRLIAEDLGEGADVSREGEST